MHCLNAAKLVKSSEMAIREFRSEVVLHDQEKVLANVDPTVNDYIRVCIVANSFIR
jgi:hypothetical protein